MHASLPALSHLAIRCACATLLLGMASPCQATTASEVVNTLLTSRFLERERCDHLGLVSVQLLQNLNQGVGVNQRPALSRGQVREIATRYVEINAQLCDAVTAVYAGQDAWARSYGKLLGSSLSGNGWDRFLADKHALRWAEISARFRTELITLNGAINLAVALRPDAFNPDTRRLRDLHLPATRKLLQDIRRVSLTDEEAKVRFALATLDEQPAFREMIPARLDINQLAAIEAKTRQIGLHFLDKYDVYLDDLYNPRTRMQLLTVENHEHGPKLAATVRTATTQLKALASKYR
ncbi:hypothetical protein [Massilia yuzhufengensis]|uniref:Imelysin n=1 Tax=Massilia yuzhufengensis TaxID=1164594 RepID=A0A1I1TDU3_9BURK|nr:hypothetical protein [Massilia yuzhufengensis]SFD54483.1 hypothetical protein SAMN05216204_12821 [Massilia yuzhufengensis]